MTDLLTVAQCAQRLHCSPRHVYDLIAEAGLPAVRIGESRGLRVAADRLERWIRTRENDRARAVVTDIRRAVGSSSR